MSKIAKELGLTVIVVTHDLDWAMSRADKLVFLWSGGCFTAAHLESWIPPIRAKSSSMARKRT